MLKYFNFSIFLTILGIVSLAPEILGGDHGPVLGTDFLKSFSKNYDSGTNQRFSQQRSFSTNELDQIDSHVLQLKGKNRNEQVNNRPMETVYKCFINGQYRPMNAGEKCNGALSITTRYAKQDTPQPVSTNENINKLPLPQISMRNPFSRQNSLNPTLSNQNSFNSPSSSQNKINSPPQNQYGFNSPSPIQNILNSLPQNQNSFKSPVVSEEPSPFNKYSQNALKPISSSHIMKEDNVPSKTEDPPGYNDLVDLFNSVNNGMETNNPNGVTSTSQNNTPLPEGTKIIIRDGKQRSVSMPAEIEIQKHSYERPLGLSDNEVFNIRRQVHERTNFYRARHGCNPLELNENMNNHAQEWANIQAPLYTLKGRTESENDLYGEILYASSPWDNIGQVAVDTWYNELRLINLGDSEEDLRNKHSKIRHVIQLLWTKSRDMGIGVAKSNKDNYVIVADFNPKGDVYPFVLDYLPKFQQQHIEAAQKAHNATKKTMKMLPLENDQLVEPVPDSNSYNGDNDLQKHEYNNVSPIGHSTDSNEPPKSKDIYTPSGQKIPVRMPDEKAPTPYKYSKPLGFTPEQVEEIRQDVLKKSNHYRKRYGIPPLKLNQDIDNYAQEWANILAKHNMFRHRYTDEDSEKRDIVYGENIHRSSKVPHVGELAVDLWYYEVGLIGKDDTDDELFANDDIGHATQLLWKSTKEMGVGAAVDGNGHVVVVANYNPTGNIEHFYVDNLPKFEQTDIDEGKRLQKVIDDLKKNGQTERGKTMKLPGWQSELYK